jgi:hypothetical protein
MFQRWGISCLLFSGAFAFYLHGAYPTVSAGDSGEFITAAQTLGIAHPSGFPSYTILGNFFSHLVPWANPGFKLNLFSAALGAAAVAMMYAMLLAAGVRPVIAAAVALLAAFGRAHIANSQASEVFELLLVFSIAIFWAAISGKWILSAFLMGLAAGNHQTVVLLFPALLFIFWSERRQNGRAVSPFFLPVAALFFAIGFSVNAFLFIRASHAPFLNVGQPDTFERWWRVITRADYGSLTLALGTAPERNMTMTFRQITRFVDGIAHQLPWPVMALSALVILLACKRMSSKCLGALFIFLFMGPIFFLMGNLPFDAQSLGLLERFYIVPFFFWLASFAMAGETLAKRWPRAAWATLVLPLIGATSAFAFPLRSDFHAYAYGRNNLRTLPPHALFVMDGGDDTFYTLAYLTQCEGRRRDLELHDRGGVVFPKLYGDDFRRLTKDEKEERRRWTERSLLNAGRTVFFSTMNLDIFKGLSIRPSGFLYGGGSGLKTNISWEIYDFRGESPWTRSFSEPVADYRTRSLMPFYNFQRAVDAATRRQWDEARVWIESAHAVGTDTLWLAPNLKLTLHLWAYDCVNHALLPQARAFYRLIVRWFPEDELGWENLGTVYQKEGNLQEAARCGEKAVAINPRSAAAHFNLAATLWRQSRWPDVVQELEAVLSIDPNYPGAVSFLSRAQQMPGARSGAAR